MPEGCHASPVLQDNIGLIFFEEFFIMDIIEPKMKFPKNWEEILKMKGNFQFMIRE